MADLFRTTFTDAVAEKSTFRLTGTLKDDEGVVIPSGDIAALTVTLYRMPSGSIINSRDGQDIKNANGGTIHATSGAWALVLSGLDNAIEDGRGEETHQAQIKWTYNAGAKDGYHVFEFKIANLLKVT